MSYANAEPDLFAANTRRVITHLNTFHGEQLRRWAASWAGAELADVGGASISNLTRGGLRLWKIGKGGASEIQIEFIPAIKTLEEFARLVRYQGSAAGAETNDESYPDESPDGIA